MSEVNDRLLDTLYETLERAERELLRCADALGEDSPRGTSARDLAGEIRFIASNPQMTPTG